MQIETGVTMAPVFYSDGIFFQDLEKIIAIPIDMVGINLYSDTHIKQEETSMNFIHTITTESMMCCCMNITRAYTMAGVLSCRCHAEG